MGKKLVYLASCVLVLGLVGNAFSDPTFDPALVIYYDFEDFGNSLTVLDKSGRGHDATVVGSVNGLAGAGARDSEACQITGNGSYLDLDGADFPTEDIPTTALTLAYWVKPENTGGTQTVFSALATPHSWSHGGYIRNGQYHAHVSDIDNNWIVNPYVGSVEYDEWHHMALTWELVPDEYGGGAMYIDGQLVAEYGNEFVEAPAGVEAADNWGGGARIGQDVDNSWQFTGLVDDFCLFERALEAGEILDVMTGLVKLGPAIDPLPEDEAIDIPCDVVLNWTAGPYAATHDVYLGTVFDDVNSADRANPMDLLISEGQDAAAYDPAGLLEFGQTYYWRIDEVNAAPDFTIFKGNVWSFTTEPFAYPVEGIAVTTNTTSKANEGPENIVNGSGLNELGEHSTRVLEMWVGSPAGGEAPWLQFEFDRIYKLHEIKVWNYNVEFELVLGFGVKDMTVEYSEDGATWTTLGDVQLAQGTAKSNYTANTTIDFGGLAVKYVRLTINSGFGAIPQYGLSEVRFLYIPAHARYPQPAEGATEVDVDAVVSWRAGREAASHEVYLGTDEAAVTNGTTLVDTVDPASFAAGPLDLGAMYYWKINEVNEAEAVTSWEGTVWSFMTQEYAVIDDFESYTEDEGNRVYDAWIDGWTNETGSVTGYLNGPFVERKIVNRGEQSMPLEYNNADAPFYSEAEYDLDSLDLTAYGANTLRLFVAGQADNTPAPLYVAIEDTSGAVAVMPCPDTAIVTNPDWTEWLIPYGELNGIDLSRVATLYVGVGDRDNPSAGGTGLVFIDDVGFGHPAAIE
jgi:concanavalin A-like lectin/glucanase superfamily protein/F5/8 type C domain-containing protein